MRYQWVLKHYNLAGGGITAASYDGSVSNEIKHATDRRVHFVLDNYEDLNFNLYLDDPMAATIKPITSVVKLWRYIYTDSGSLVYADPSGTPAFGGFVTFVEKNGESNQMQVRVFSPLWRLKTRFHIRNHYLKTNPDTGINYTTSEIIWRFISYLQVAFGGQGLGATGTTAGEIASPSYMGMAKGNFLWGSDPLMGPYFQGKGENGWSNIFDTIMSRAECPELIPRYYHADGSGIIMYLDTNKARGSDKTASVQFRFHTGSNDNLDNLIESVDIQEPGSFANYVWAWGSGGPNSGKLAMRANIAEDQYGYNTTKIYQLGTYYADLALFDTTLGKVADGDLKKARKPPMVYSIGISPAITGPFYGANYSTGDAVSLYASKGALSASNVKLRIYESNLSMSDNNVETVSLALGNDDKEHILAS